MFHEIGGGDMAQVTWYSARDLVLVFHIVSVIESSFELRSEVPRGQKQCSDPSLIPDSDVYAAHDCSRTQRYSRM